MADLPKEPVTRQEEYLSRLAGENTTLPRTPVTREEMYLEGAIEHVEALEEEIAEMKANPDVADIVATYADLQSYDKSTLTDKDIIRVLVDETQDGKSTYYRYSTSTQAFTLIGDAGDYYTENEVDALLDAKADKATTYTKTEVDTALAGKQDTLIAGDNITIAQDGKTISADGLTTLSYGNSTWNDFITAYNAGKIVYCRASSGSNPGVGNQTRMAFMAYINNPTTPTEVEFQYVRSNSTKSASTQSDQVFVYKLTSSGTWTVETRPVMVKIVAGNNMTSSYSNNTLTLNATGGGSSVTSFYYSGESIMDGDQVYKDVNCTITATSADIKTAYDNGGARLEASTGTRKYTITGYGNADAYFFEGAIFKYIDNYGKIGPYD